MNSQALHVQLILQVVEAEYSFVKAQIQRYNAKNTLTLHLRLNDRAKPTAQQPFNSICAKAVFPQHLRVLGGVYPALQQN